MFGVVDERRVSRDQHQMIRPRRPSNFAEESITKRELSGVRKVVWDVGFDELLFDSGGLSGQPRAVSVIRVLGWWVWRSGHGHPINSRESAEVVVETVVLFDDDHNMLNGLTGQALDSGLSPRYEPIT